jgi:predicted dehydrogenase
MAVASAKAKRTLLFNFNNRARPETVEMMRHIQQGAVGRVNSAQAKWVRRCGIPGFGGWFTSKSDAGGGALIDLLHMIDLAFYFMGCPEPNWVLASTFSDFIGDRSFKGPWGIKDVTDGITDVENACHGAITFREGQIITFQTSWAELIKQEEVSVSFQGTKAGGQLRRSFGIDGVDGTSFDTNELYTQSVSTVLDVARDETMGRVRSASNFINVVEGKEIPFNTPAQAVDLMRIIDAAYESARTGRPAKC